MIRILDHFENTPRAFHPKTAKDFLALQLARKLNDLENLRTYRVMIDHHSDSVIAEAYRRASKDSITTPHQFRLELDSVLKQQKE